MTQATNRARMVGGALMFLLAVVAFPAVLAIEFVAIRVISVLWVERSYERAGITDGGGGPGDAHAYHLAWLRFFALLAVQVGVVLAGVFAHRRREDGSGLDGG